MSALHSAATVASVAAGDLGREEEAVDTKAEEEEETATVARDWNPGATVAVLAAVDSAARVVEVASVDGQEATVAETAEGDWGLEVLGWAAAA